MALESNLSLDSKISLGLNFKFCLAASYKAHMSYFLLRMLDS